MNNCKKLFLSLLFVASGAFAQEGGLKGALLNDASIGVNVGMLSYIADDANNEMGFGFNYTKQVNSVLGLQE